MTALREPGTRLYAVGLGAGAAVCDAELLMQSVVLGHSLGALMLWLPWLVYGTATFVWALSLLTTRDVRGRLLLLALVPLLPLNLYYLLFLYPLHLVPAAFFALGSVATFTSERGSRSWRRLSRSIHFGAGRGSRTRRPISPPCSPPRAGASG